MKTRPIVRRVAFLLPLVLLLLFFPISTKLSQPSSSRASNPHPIQHIVFRLKENTPLTPTSAALPAPMVPRV